MGQRPDEIRQEIEATRRDMGQTLDEIENRVSPRRIAERRTQRVRSAWTGLRESVMGGSDTSGGGAAGTAQRAGEAVRHAPDSVQQRARGNPLGAGTIAFGAGLLAASLIPRSHAEEAAAAEVDERLQPVKEELTAAAQESKARLQQAAHEAVEDTKDSAAQAAATVRQDTRDAADAVSGQARAAAEDVRGQAAEQTGGAGDDPHDDGTPRRPL